MEVLAGIVFGILVFVYGSIFMTVILSVLYDLATALLPIFTVLMIFVGVLVGLFAAVKNTFSVYHKIYLKRGK